MIREHVGRHELRYMDDGTLDEIVVNDEHGRCILHLERVSDCSVAVNLYLAAGDERQLVIESKIGSASPVEMSVSQVSVCELTKREAV